MEATERGIWYFSIKILTISQPLGYNLMEFSVGGWIDSRYRAPDSMSSERRVLSVELRVSSIKYPSTQLTN